MNIEPENLILHKMSDNDIAEKITRKVMTPEELSDMENMFKFTCYDGWDSYKKMKVEIERVCDGQKINTSALKENVQGFDDLIAYDIHRIHRDYQILKKRRVYKNK